MANSGYTQVQPGSGQTQQGRQYMAAAGRNAKQGPANYAGTAAAAVAAQQQALQNRMSGRPEGQSPSPGYAAAGTGTAALDSHLANREFNQRDLGNGNILMGPTMPPPPQAAPVQAAPPATVKTDQTHPGSGNMARTGQTATQQTPPNGGQQAKGMPSGYVAPVGSGYHAAAPTTRGVQGVAPRANYAAPSYGITAQGGGGSATPYGQMYSAGASGGAGGGGSGAPPPPPPDPNSVAAGLENGVSWLMGNGQASNGATRSNPQGSPYLNNPGTTTGSAFSPEDPRSKDNPITHGNVPGGEGADPIKAGADALLPKFDSAAVDAAGKIAKTVMDPANAATDVVNEGTKSSLDKYYDHYNDLAKQKQEGENLLDPGQRAAAEQAARDQMQFGVNSQRDDALRGMIAQMSRGGATRSGDMQGVYGSALRAQQEGERGLTQDAFKRRLAADQQGGNMLNDAAKLKYGTMENEFMSGKDMMAMLAQLYPELIDAMTPF